MRIFQSNSHNERVLRWIVIVTLSAVLAIALALIYGVVFLDMPNGDARSLIELLVSSAVISLGSGSLFVWLSEGRSWNRLGTRLLVAHAIGMSVLVINIAIAAYSMFLSTHDLSLLGLLLAYSFAIAAIYSILVSTSISNSLSDLAHAAREMSAGELSVRVRLAPERELAEVGTAFNTMAERLEAAFHRQWELEEARQGLIAAVSHDLRTPLASMRVMVEAINDGVASDPETIKRYIQSIERETVSLGRLIDDLFEMARLDAGQVQLRLEASPIVSLVQETLETMGAQAARQGVVLQSHTDRVPPVLIDSDRIQRVLYNLIQNAIRHTPEDGSVIVEVLDRGPEVQVNVRDTGEGIAAIDLPHVFERFYRGDKARTRDASAGAGLGLSIAKRLIETHGGRIRVAQPPEGGSVFCFTLPKATRA